MKRMTSRFGSVCGTCKNNINKGDEIAYMGHGIAHHAACYDADPKKAEAATPDTQPRRFGHVPYGRKHGRCEDAPCCGCCS